MSATAVNATKGRHTKHRMINAVSIMNSKVPLPSEIGKHMRYYVTVSHAWHWTIHTGYTVMYFTNKREQIVKENVQDITEERKGELRKLYMEKLHVLYSSLKSSFFSAFFYGLFYNSVGIYGLRMVGWLLNLKEPVKEESK
jgi:hypothetical protein